MTIYDVIKKMDRETLIIIISAICREYPNVEINLIDIIKSQSSALNQ